MAGFWECGIEPSSTIKADKLCLPWKECSSTENGYTLECGSKEEVFFKKKKRHLQSFADL
jgi:hypothetical protein